MPPIMTYIGTESYAVNFQLRAGKQHCQNGRVEFIRETVRLCKQLTGEPLLIHLDSENDSIDNVAILVEEGCYFIIKRNLRREGKAKENWLKMAKECCLNITTPRDGKNVLKTIIYSVKTHGNFMSFNPHQSTYAGWL